MVLVAHPKKKLPPHARKRQAGHHRQTRHYTQTYWPYLTMLAVIFCGFIFNSLWTPSRQVLGYSSDLTASSLLQRTNTTRLRHNDQPLTLNSQLAGAAQSKANDMVKRNYWSHTTPDGRQPWAFASDNGYRYSVIGENLAYGFDGSDSVVNAWLNSPAHRDNVLSQSYSEVGFGLASAANFQGKGQTTVVVALYGAPQGSAAEVNSGAGNVLPAKTVSRLETVSTTNAALVAIVASMAAAACAIFVTLKHGRLLKRALVKGEVFIVRHHILDLIMLGLGGVGFVITRSAGVIH